MREKTGIYDSDMSDDDEEIKEKRQLAQQSVFIISFDHASCSLQSISDKLTEVQ